MMTTLILLYCTVVSGRPLQRNSPFSRGGPRPTQSYEQETPQRTEATEVPSRMSRLPGPSGNSGDGSSSSGEGICAPPAAMMAEADLKNLIIPFNLFSANFSSQLAPGLVPTSGDFRSGNNDDDRHEEVCKHIESIMNAVAPDSDLEECHWIYNCTHSYNQYPPYIIEAHCPGNIDGRGCSLCNSNPQGASARCTTFNTPQPMTILVLDQGAECIDENWRETTREVRLGCKCS